MAAVRPFSGRSESISATLPAALAIRSRSLGEKLISTDASLSKMGFPLINRAQLRTFPVMARRIPKRRWFAKLR